MSIRYYTKVIVGFKLELDDVMVTKTKYDPDTGKPYEKTEGVGERALIDGTIVIPKWEYSLEHEGMEVIESGYECGELFLGSVIGKVREGFWVDYIPFGIVSTPAVKEFADKHGLKPKMFLVMSCG